MLDNAAKARSKLAATLGVAAAFAACPVAWTTATPAQDAVKAAPPQVKEAPTEVKKAQAQPAAVDKAVVEIRREADGKMVPLAGAFPAVNPEQVVKQVVDQLRSTFRAELRLMTSASDPTPALRTEVAVEAGKAVKEIAVKLAGTRNAANAAVINRLNTPSSDPHRQVRDAFQAAAKAKLSPEQFDRYLAELKRKGEIRREAAVLNLVANIDRLLALDTTQRHLLAEQFRAHWDDRDYPTLEQSITYDSYYPSLPDPHILPILSKPQREIWQAARKINFSALRTSNVVQNQAVAPADPDEDPDVKAALDGGGKP